MKRIMLIVFIIFVLALISNSINQYDENKIKYSEKSSKIEIKKFDNKEKNYISLKGGSAGRSVGRIGGRSSGKIGIGKSSSGKGSGSANKVPPRDIPPKSPESESKPLTKTPINYNNKNIPKIYRPVIRNNVDTEIDNFRTSNPFYSVYPRWTYYFNPPYMRHYNNTKSITEEEQWTEK